MFSMQTGRLAPAAPYATRSGVPGRMARLARRTFGLARSGVALGRALRQLVRERRELGTLDPRIMRDLGISRAAADQEARRPWLVQLREIRWR